MFKFTTPKFITIKTSKGERIVNLNEIGMIEKKDNSTGKAILYFSGSEYRLITEENYDSLKIYLGHFRLI